jgi:hypothetical protein
LTPVRTTRAITAASWPPLIDQAQEPIGTENRMCWVEKNGRKLPRYSPKATPSAALPPDMITRKAIQP